MILFSPLILAVLWAFIGTFVRQLRKDRACRRWALAGVGLFVASIVLEASALASPPVEEWSRSGFLRIYPLLTSIEEYCELIGVTLVIVGLGGRIS